MLGLVNVGRATLDGSQVLDAPEDYLQNDLTRLYFDIILHPDGRAWEWKNQLFYEAYENVNENAYGFSQFHDTWVIED